MESNKDDINNGGDQHQHQQLRENARKHTFNELANDEDKPAAAGEEDPNYNTSKKNRQDKGNDLDLEVCLQYIFGFEKERRTHGTNIVYTPNFFDDLKTTFKLVYPE
jgi:hypothetical protein